MTVPVALNYLSAGLEEEEHWVCSGWGFAQQDAKKKGV